MINLKNIHSLSDFLRNAKSYVGKLKKSKSPAVLTVNGQAELVVMSADAFQKLLEELELAENLSSIHKGMLEAQRGEGIPADELIRRLRMRKARTKSA
jgi:PHD/YefM family antitoxin component YafN of YafNO toxin-antitoxin module